MSEPSVDVVVPVFNEAHVLERSVETIRRFLHQEFPYPARIVIVDNGSTDATREVAQRLAARYDDVGFLALRERGRGRALRAAWQQSSADIALYTDVDISTELGAAVELCHAIHRQGYDVAIGSRLLPASRVTRGLKRELVSRIYSLLVRWVLTTRLADVQCGFKAVSRRIVREVVPQVKDEWWFFDTELLVLAEKQGYRIKEVPVRWVDDPDSRVRILPTGWQAIQCVLRLRRLLRSRACPRALGVAHRAGSE